MVKSKKKFRTTISLRISTHGLELIGATRHKTKTKRGKKK